MARYNELLVGRFNRQVQKLFSMKGPASLRTVSDELMPTHTFFSGAENRYLESWQRFGQFVNQAAVAAQTSQIRVRNPVGSNVIAVFEKIYVTELAATADQPFLELNAATTDLATIFVLSGNSRFDPRGQKDPTCIISNAAPGAGLGGAKWKTSLGANSGNSPGADVIVADIQEFVLFPGDALQMNSTVVNVSLSTTFWWRERFLEDSERT